MHSEFSEIGFLDGVAQSEPETLDVLAVYDVFPSYAGGDVVQIEDSVWATEHDEATLVELRAAGP